MCEQIQETVTQGPRHRDTQKHAIHGETRTSDNKAHVLVCFGQEIEEVVVLFGASNLSVLLAALCGYSLALALGLSRFLQYRKGKHHHQKQPMY